MAKWLATIITGGAILICIGLMPAHAGVVFYPTNGHYYERVEAPGVTWSGAKLAAEAMEYMGVRGSLVTITSAEEQAFIVANVGAGMEWLGGYQDLSDPDYSEPGGGWKWVTGEPWAYTNWVPGGPNNGGDENCLMFWGPEGFWNDGYWVNGGGAYIVEYPVPEPSSLLALAGGLAGAVALARRRRE